MMKTNNPRAAALSSLLSWEKKGRYANLEVNASLTGSSMSEADKGLYTALVYGVIERAITLDYAIKALSDRPIDKIDEVTLTAIRLGLYQLSYMDRIPPHAAVSETVDLAPARSRGFVNALLRTFQRKGCTLPLPSDKDPIERLSVEFSAPEDLCRFWLARYDLETTRALLASTVRNPKVTVRVNTLKLSVDEALSRLAPVGASLSPLSGDMLVLDHAAHIANGIRDGLYFVQDVSSRLAVRALDPQPNETVIDTCAAPGGKSMSAALDMRNTGTLYSFDLHENKLSLIRKTAECLGITILTAAQRNAKDPDPSLIGKADRVLCDAPCSGLGVIGKKPDIKYKPLAAIEALPEVQFEILSGAAQYVRPGGVLVYSTCTVNPDENEHVVARFQKEHPDFTPAPFTLGAAGDCPDGMRTFYPHKDGCDGFFLAKMIKNKD